MSTSILRAAHILHSWHILHTSSAWIAGQIWANGRGWGKRNQQNYRTREGFSAHSQNYTDYHCKIQPRPILFSWEKVRWVYALLNPHLSLSDLKPALCVLKIFDHDDRDWWMEKWARVTLVSGGEGGGGGCFSTVDENITLDNFSAESLA